MGNIKIKTDGGTFLTEISQIALDGSFQANLQSAIDQINENFSKIISLPFLQGDAGDSVETVTIKLSESSELKNAIATAIYSNSNHNNQNDDNYGGTINGVGSWNADQINREVVFYRKKEITNGEEKFFFYSPSLYLFIDDRIKMLSQTLDDSILMSFRDLSCALTISGEADMNPATGEPTGCIFTATKQDIIPNLYYDTDSKYWCWSINGVDTKVIAQGVKGDPGIDAKVFICNGEKLSNQSSSVQNIIKITEILQPLSDDNTTGVATPETISEGSLLVVWFDDNTTDANNNINNCTFGVARHADDYVYISTSEISSINLDLATLISSLNLYRELNDITNPAPENNTHAIRGLYVPDCSNMDDSVGDSYVHMTWADGGNRPKSDNTVNIGLVHSSKRLMSASGSIEEENGDTKGYSTARGKLDIKYPEVVSHKTSLKKDPGDMTIDVQAYDKSYSSSPISVTIPSSNTITVGEDQKRVVVSEGSVLIKNISDGTDEKLSLIIDQDEHTSSHIINGELSLDNASMRIGNTSEYSTQNGDFGIKEMDPDRWSLKNKGIKLHNSDIIVHGGSVISSSKDNLGSVLVSDNTVQFDYKITESVKKSMGYGISPEEQEKLNRISESRPRHKDFVPVKISGYSTIYNSITNNANKTEPNPGSVRNTLSDVCNPLILTPEENMKNAFISGKMGYTSMVENHGLNDIFKIEGVSEINTVSEDLCLVTSYDAIWTKIGNVVDVKGKIFFNSAKFSADADSGKITVSNPEPLTYSQFFKFFTENGNKIGFPMPVVINNVQNEKDCYQISTGNLLDNIKGEKQKDVPIVNKPIISSDTNYSVKSPSTSINSSYQYHNDLLNGIANFHFYGNRINTSVSNSPGLDITNEVFSVSAGISRHQNYDDRYWGLCHIPNYDIINCVRSGHATNFDNTSSDNRPFLNSLSSDDNGPVKIVEVEQDSEKYCPQTSRYQYTNAIIGKRYAEKISIEDDKQKLVKYKYKGEANALDIDTVTGEDYSEVSRTTLTSSYHVIEESPTPRQTVLTSTISTPLTSAYDVTNESSQHAYKISTNIGPYRIRYITFSFSYILEDDIPNSYIMNSNEKYICGDSVGMPDDQQYPSRGGSNLGILDSEFIESVVPEHVYEEVEPGDITVTPTP